jgi:hypothetical protein
MDRRPRRNHTPTFKAKVALAALGSIALHAKGVWTQANKSSYLMLCAAPEKLQRKTPEMVYKDPLGL